MRFFVEAICALIAFGIILLLAGLIYLWAGGRP
jgi:hypothetical protein